MTSRNSARGHFAQRDLSLQHFFLAVTLGTWPSVGKPYLIRQIAAPLRERGAGSAEVDRGAIGEVGDRHSLRTEALNVGQVELSADGAEQHVVDRDADPR